MRIAELCLWDGLRSIWSASSGHQKIQGYLCSHDCFCVDATSLCCCLLRDPRSGEAQKFQATWFSIRRWREDATESWISSGTLCYLRRSSTSGFPSLISSGSKCRSIVRRIAVFGSWNSGRIRAVELESLWDRPPRGPVPWFGSVFQVLHSFQTLPVVAFEWIRWRKAPWIWKQSLTTDWLDSSSALARPSLFH